MANGFIAIPDSNSGPIFGPQGPTTPGSIGPSNIDPSMFRTGIGPGYDPNKKKQPTSPFDPQVQTAALETQSKDYDRLMGEYEDLLGSLNSKNASGANTRLQFSPISPKTIEYNLAPELTNTIASLRDYAGTGGFSDQDVSNIRARGVSPIRSIYANAQRNLDRQRALQGGYSPNYAAASAKMARELSSQLGDATTGLEADLAQKRSANRLSALSALSPLSTTAANIKSQYDMYNADTANRMAEFNALTPLQFQQFNNQQEADDFMRRMQAIEGMRGLYGTTPALASTFGNQVLQEEALNKEQPEDISPGVNLASRAFYPGGRRY